MDVDPISELLRLVDARCQLTGGLRAGGVWSHQSAVTDAIKIDAITEGSCWIVVDRRSPLRLVAGDVVVVTGARTVRLGSDPVPAPDAVDRAPRRDGFFVSIGDRPDVTVLGGHVELDPAGTELFASALPTVLHVGGDGDRGDDIRRTLEQIVAEAARGRPGARFAADQHAQLLLLHVLRVGLRADTVRHPGWLRLLTDPELRPAVDLLHTDPARAWGLTELAAATGMSRSHFAHRFRETAGQPPLTYLAHWRVQLARQALRSSRMTISAIGEQLGYASDSSFTHAFTRIAGISPARYRRAHSPTAHRSGDGPALSAETASTARPR